MNPHAGSNLRNLEMLRELTKREVLRVGERVIE